MKRILLPLLVALGLTLASCGAAPAAPAAPAAVQSGESIDVASLPVNIDAATVRALQQRDDVVVLDVREPDEYAAGHIPGVQLIPMGQVPARLNEIPTDKTVIVTCRSGNRSNQITSLLRQNGFTSVHNMSGGILAWQQAGFPVER